MNPKEIWETLLYNLREYARVKVRTLPAMEGYWVIVSLDPQTTSPTEAMMVHLADWATAGNVGRRMSFDMWTFDSEAQMMMFLLKWDGQLSPI